MSTRRKKNILLVDDDPFLQSLYRKTLEREGFNILTAADGVAALQKLPEEPDLVVLDLMLPKLDGMKVLETIRKSEGFKELPILILSNAYLPDAAQEALAAGATAGILKSECSPKRLVGMIRETLKNRSVAAEAKQPAAKSSWLPSLLRGKNGSGDHEQSARSAAMHDDDEPMEEPTVSPEFQNELQRNWPTEIAMIRGVCLKYAKSAGTPEAEDHLREIYRRLRLISARSAMAEWFRISQLGSALEAMLFEHGAKSEKAVSQSVLQTMFQAVDCLEHLFKAGRSEAIQRTQKIRILLVDDDPVCNQANDLALKRMNIDTACVGDGDAALKLLEKNSFDLVLLDVELPGLSGFEVCKTLRKLALCKETPVIFVTIKDDFQSRAQSVLCGGNSLIPKPISPLELIVRTLIFLLRPFNIKPAAEPATPVPPAVPKVPAEKAKVMAPVPAQKVVAEGGKKLDAAQVAVDEKVKALTEALALETKRRETAEQLAAEQSRLQRKLEEDRAENEKAREKLQQMLEQARQQAQNLEPGQAANLDGRTRALLAVQDFMDDKSKKLTKKLAEQTIQTQTANDQAADCAKRMGEFESSLAEIRKAKDALLQELQAAGNGANRTEIESAIAENKRNEDTLVQKIEATWQEFEARQIEEAMAASSPIDDRAKLEGDLAAVQEKMNALAQALEAESKRSEAAERKAAEISEKRSALEAELANSSTTQAELRAQLDEQKKKLDAQILSHQAELGQLAGRAKHLELVQADVEEKIKSLTLALEAETKRSQTAESQASEIDDRRSALEAELLASKHAQARLREQLAEQQKQLDSQGQTHDAELGNLASRTKELEAGRVALEEKIQSLTQALSNETKRSETAEQQSVEASQRRAALEAELAKSSQAQNQLRDQLAEQQQNLDAQMQAHQTELNNLSSRSKELESSRAEIEERVKSLTQALEAEKKKSESAEHTISEANGRRDTLEAELVASRQEQAQLRSQLEEQNRKLEAQVQAHKAELGNFNGLTKELETKCLSLEEKIGSLTKDLASEAKRSEKAELKISEISGRRNELESELAATSEAQAKLRGELAEQQKLMETQAQVGQAELAKLNERIQELEAQCEALEAKIKSLSKSLASEAKKLEKAEQKASEVEERRAALERELAASNEAQAQLRNQLAELQQKFEAQVQAHQAELGKSVEQSKELQNVRGQLEEKIKGLTESLAAESSRSERAEQLANDITQRRNSLEAELAASNQAQAELRQQLAEQQKRLDSELHTHYAQVDSLAGKTKELEATRVAVEEKVKSLTQALADETRRSETAERQVAETNQRRAVLETDLAAGNQLQAQFQEQIADLKKQLEAQIGRHQAEIAQLSGRTKEIESSRAAVEEKVKSLTQALEAETKRSESAEHQVGELASRRNALESELTSSNHAQSELRAKLAEQEKQLEVRLESGNAELGKLAAQAKNLETVRAIQEEKINALTEALSVEMKRAKAATEQAAETDKQKFALQAELDGSREAQAQLMTQIAEQQQQLHLVSAELEGFRRCAQDEAVRHTKMAGQIAESEKSLADITAQLQSAKALASSREDAISALNHELQKHRDAHERLDVSMKGEVAHRQEIEAQIAAVRTQLDEASRHLAQKCAAEQTWLAREAELQAQLHGQQDELVKSKSAIATQEAELKNARIKVEESQILQTVLCAKIQVLTDQGHTAAKAIQELEAKAAQSGLSNKHLAGLRYAVLDASRMSAKLQLERFQMERQNLDAMRKLLSSLVQTPLSMAQRGMLAEVQNSMDGLDNIRAVATQVAACPVEMPNFQPSEFVIAEVMESAFGAVRSAAKATGVVVHAAVSDAVAGKVIGYVEHLHQLTMLLGLSPLNILPGVNACKLRAETKSVSTGFTELTLRVLFEAQGKADELLERCNSVTAEALTPKATSFTESEFGLAAAWQLALAMGAQPSINVSGGNEVCLTVSVTMEAPRSPVENGAPKAQPKSESNGNGHYTRKAKAGARHVDQSCAITE